MTHAYEAFVEQDTGVGKDVQELIFTRRASKEELDDELDMLERDMPG